MIELMIVVAIVGIIATSLILRIKRHLARASRRWQRCCSGWPRRRALLYQSQSIYRRSDHGRGLNLKDKCV
jgi:type II secretory pathway pseudopilin PulG